jgi:hypothetical protein
MPDLRHAQTLRILECTRNEVNFPSSVHPRSLRIVFQHLESGRPKPFLDPALLVKEISHLSIASLLLLPLRRTVTLQNPQRLFLFDRRRVREPL